MVLGAVIFDLDGTVLSNEDEWGEAFSRVLKKLGVKKISNLPHVRGIGVRENWPPLLKKFNLKTKRNLDELYLLTKREYEKLLPKVTLKRGYTKFVGNLKKSNVLIGLATSSSWSVLEQIFDKFDIEKDFDCITTGDEVNAKKPDPQVFNITVKKLGADRTECLVIEDAAAGIEAAKLAGLKTVGIAWDEKHKKTLRKADFIIADYNELTPEVISKL